MVSDCAAFEKWDAIVVGAGPAGCAAAYDLAAAGRRVLLVDKAAFPRAKACAGGLTLKAVRALRYSIDPVVRRWERRIVLEETANRSVTVGRGTPVCAMTVRAELDQYCIQQTLARGAAWQQIGPIEAIEQNERGVTLRLAGSAPLRASYVVGADGVHSRVRALQGPAPWLRKAFALELNVPYREGEGELYPVTFDFGAVPGGYGWLFPRNDHVNVGLYAETAEGRSDAGSRLNTAALQRYVAQRCGMGRETSRPVGQFLGLGAAGYRPEPGNRVLLAGDAAGFVDPLTGEGIYGAIRSGQMAAAAIRSVLEGGWPAEALHQRFCKEMQPLRADLQVAEHAGRRFYSEPALGFRLLRLPMMARLVLKMYGEGMPLGWLLRAVHVGGQLGGVHPTGSGMAGN